MGNYVEVEEFVTPGRVEWAYGRAMEAQARRVQRFLKVLECSANIISKIDEEQRGRTRRAADTPYAESVETTVTQMFRGAYETVDKGTPVRALEWIYGAAALMCGYLD